MKKTVLAVFAVFLTWSILDFVIHGLILGSAYSTLPQLFRPMAEMNLLLIYGVTLISSFVFVHVYVKYVSNKSLHTALGYSAWLGIAYGFGMGYGTYSAMPIPHEVALTWFLGTFVEFVAAGLLVGLMVKE